MKCFTISASSVQEGMLFSSKPQPTVTVGCVRLPVDEQLALNAVNQTLINADIDKQGDHCLSFVHTHDSMKHGALVKLELPRAVSFETEGEIVVTSSLRRPTAHTYAALIRLTPGQCIKIKTPRPYFLADDEHIYLYERHRIVELTDHATPKMRRNHAIKQQIFA